MSNRVYERKFDWDEALRLREEGLSYRKIGEMLGVSTAAVNYAVDEKAREKMNARAGEYQRSGTCPDCGGPASRNYTDNHTRPGRCQKCANRAKQTRFRRDDDDRIVEVRCSRCEEWKARGEFQAGSGSEGINSLCRSCNTDVRRDYRNRHREEDRAYARERQRQRRREGAA